MCNRCLDDVWLSVGIWPEEAAPRLFLRCSLLCLLCGTDLALDGGQAETVGHRGLGHSVLREGVDVFAA